MTTSWPSLCLATGDGMNHQHFVLFAGDFLDALSGSNIERLSSGLCFVFRDDPVHFVHVGGRGIVLENGGIALRRKRQNLGFHIWPPAGLTLASLGEKPAGFGPYAPYCTLAGRCQEGICPVRRRKIITASTQGSPNGSESHFLNSSFLQRARGIAITFVKSLGGTATPSRKATTLPELAATRSPGTMMPTRFRGSAAESVMTSPAGC